MKFYKVRNKHTGLFHAGGSYNIWSKSGKTYDTLGKLRAMITNHLKYRDYRRNESIDDWEIIEFEMVETATKQVHEVMDPKKIMQLLAK